MEVTKDVFVDVAGRDFQVPNRKMTQARIAIVTGLTRKEVSRILQKQHGSDRLSTNLGRVTRLLAGWHTDPEFTGPYGLPLELKYDRGNRRDFLELARRYSADMPPRAMLDELLRIGVVQEDEFGTLKVLTRTYLPKVEAPDSLDRMSRAVKNFVETLDHNRVEADPEKRLFERTVVADEGISLEELPAFTAFIGKKSQLLLEEIDNWLNKLDGSRRRKSEVVVHTGLGIYHYIDRDADT
jgi:transcriptional regulator with XRE-family HTH domain